RYAGEGHPRGASPPAGDQPRGPLSANLTQVERGEQTISEAEWEQTIEEFERAAPQEEYDIGDHVVYPHHGAGKILKKEMKEILGEKRDYLTIKILHNDMTVMVPCENAGKAGLRRVIDDEAVQKVLAVLRDDVSQMPKKWNRRFKHNRDKIKTGDAYELAEVVRNLAIREADKGLSTGEKQMYTRAKKILVCAGRPLIDWSLDVLIATCDRVVVAVPPGEELGADRIHGGRFRSESVKLALDAAPEASTAVVHDAARPLVTAELVTRCISAVN